MDLSPEERKRIYEEEKAKIEAREQHDREKGNIPLESSTSLAPRVAGLLCYLGVWITGIIFLVIEQKNKWVRFHAAQSIVVFGSLIILGSIFGNIPFIKYFFGPAISITGLILWIVLMVKAYNGERFKLPLAGDIAEMIVGQAGDRTNYPPPPPAGPPSPEGVSAPPPPPPPPPSSYSAPAAPLVSGNDKKTQRKIDDWFSHRREGRITASAFAIAWNIILLVFFNFFWQYVAFYTGDSTGAGVTWTKETFFTNDIRLWLPILNAALAVSIVSHIVIILIDNDLLHQALRMIMDAFGLAVVITLLVIFPFDFSVIPNHAAATGTSIGVTVVLIVLSIGLGIGLLVRLIKLLVSIAKAITRAS